LARIGVGKQKSTRRHNKKRHSMVLVQRAASVPLAGLGREADRRVVFGLIATLSAGRMPAAR
jgi:hypothetical protein